MRNRRWIAAAWFAAAATAACAGGFRVARFPTTPGLYAASLAEFNKGKWDNAITGFEKLTLDLGARDTLLPLANWYLASAHDRRGEHIIAATTFSRLAESFPDDTLADDALVAAGDAYLAVWRRPELDPQYGTLAQLAYRQLLSVFPDSPLAARAEAGLLRIDEMFAQKDYDTGMYYVRRGAYDSSILMFKYVVKDYPNTNHARLALMRMVEVYRRPQMNYKEEAAETCTTLRAAYADNPEVAALCPPSPGAGPAPARGDSAARPPR
jgi:outer membrane protein assembly factor BamD